MSTAVLRQHAEVQFAEELDQLRKVDTRQRPGNWLMSPWAVVTYLVGGRLDNGFEVSAKYIGSRRLMEIAVATLATDRALLLFGVPGTAKSWVSEHLAAAISGDSTLLVQGTAGTSEEQIRYGWNYAQLLANGPSEAALVPSPLMQAMKLGKIARIEELTRIPADVQDALITVLSEKTLPIPELASEVQATRGFSVIATGPQSPRPWPAPLTAKTRATLIHDAPATQPDGIDAISIAHDPDAGSLRTASPDNQGKPAFLHVGRYRISEPLRRPLSPILVQCGSPVRPALALGPAAPARGPRL